jgi:C-terminal processing protease CtpA/Prc
MLSLGIDDALAVSIAVRRRGLPAGSGRTVLGQRALEAPTILLTDRNTLSDGEDLSEGYRTLGLGKIVGEATAGWIIYTSNVTLIDGSVFRLPMTGVKAADGTNMERNPRPVDLAVARPVGETDTGRDAQLDAAVRELLSQIGRDRANRQARGKEDRGR